MSQTVPIEEIFAVMDNAFDNGAGNCMRERETLLGYQLIFPGDASWFPSSDWHPDTVVSLNGKEVRITAIYAVAPGSGAFSRAISGIVRAGLVPVVLAPFDEMQAILERWGWHHRVIGSSFEDRVDEWWPTRKWREERARQS